MKKIFLLISLVFLVTACSLNNFDNSSKNKEEDNLEEKMEINDIEKEEYQDLNPIKIALYKKENEWDFYRDTQLAKIKKKLKKLSGL